MRRIMSLLLKNRKLHSYLLRTYAAIEQEKDQVKIVSASVPEVTPLRIRKGSLSGLRFNLLVPTVSARHVFGGISTALEFFHRLTAGCKNIRIVLTDDVHFAHADNVAFGDWKILTLDQDDIGGKTIVNAANRGNKTLSVIEGDIFIATTWWSAFLLKDLLDMKIAEFGSDQEEKYIYLIQDYEPGFNAWSSRYALAESTYRDVGRCISVFNSSMLRDFFQQEGYNFNQCYCFEPVLNSGLRRHLVNLPARPRQQKLLIYGRPSVSRNAFEIIVMALQAWTKSHPNSGWRFFSAGEEHPDINVGNGHILVSLGKLSLDDYAYELATSYAGLSLMISPHPSYPPLEMAAFGVKVITNAYRSKNLSKISPNIISVDETSPSSIVRQLSLLLQQYDIDPYAVGVNSEWLDRYVTSLDPFDQIIGLIRTEFEINS